MDTKSNQVPAMSAMIPHGMTGPDRQSHANAQPLRSVTHLVVGVVDMENFFNLSGLGTLHGFVAK